jgi:hypothetical protein
MSFGGGGRMPAIPPPEPVPERSSAEIQAAVGEERQLRKKRRGRSTLVVADEIGAGTPAPGAAEEERTYAGRRGLVGA